MAEENNPWGQKKKEPQNIDEWIDQSLKKLTGLITGSTTGNGNNNTSSAFKFGPKKIIVLFFILILLFFAFKSVFQIQPGEIGVILRFGKHYRNATPGLNFLVPFVDSLTKVNVQTVRSLEFIGNETSGKSIYDNVASMVTADRNVININWVVQFRIKNPEDFLFNIENVANTIKDFSEYALRRDVGNRDFDYILNRREELAFAAFEETQALLDKYKSGVEIVKLQLLDVVPPEKVRPAFNEVNEADQDKTRLVNEAQKEVNERVPRARGEAKQTVLAAEGYSVKKLNDSLGNTSRFSSVYQQYKKYQNVTKKELYVSTLKEVLPQLESIVVVDKKGNLLPLLNLNNNNTNNTTNSSNTTNK